MTIFRLLGDITDYFRPFKFIDNKRLNTIILWLKNFVFGRGLRPLIK